MSFPFLQRTLFGLWLALPTLALAASVEPSELAALRAEVARAGVVPVTIHLQPSTLAELRSSPGQVSAAADVKAARLLAELGPSALAAGRWNNGAGQLGLHVTGHGLDVLLGTTHAVSFFRGPAWNQRTFLSGLDGSHAAIEQSLRQRGFADVEVVANAEGLEVLYGSDGKASFRAQPQALRNAGSKLSNLIRGAREAAIADQALTARAAAEMSSTPVISMRVTREGLLALADSDAVRSVRPAGHIDARPVEIDPEAMDHAARHGETDVIVVLRDVHGGGKLSRASMRAMKRANRAALEAILAHARPDVIRGDYSEFGAVAARLAAAELGKLAQLRDPRLLAVVLNKPVADTQLANSAPTMNMASAWNAGYVASGQNVIVLDSGIEAGHAFLGNRVAYQGCFGTTGAVNGVNWISPCPGGDAANNWDSPAGTPNSAAPVGGSSHGTHVAGISTGDRTQPTVMRGTGPAANIYAIQVFSLRQGTNVITSFNQDILAALQAAANTLPALTDGRAQPFSINMSIGGGRHTGPCTAGGFAPYATAVNQLRAAGVPVIVATGNDAFQDSINFPACLPGAVKVSSVANDGVGNTRSVFNATQAANVMDTANFPGEAFWLAPGGGSGTTVVSSVVGNIYDGFSGTSMATPQITGVYAAAKGAVPTFTVNDVTAWFQANATQWVPLTVLVGGQPQQAQWRRMRLPAL